MSFGEKVVAVTGLVAIITASVLVGSHYHDKIDSALSSANEYMTSHIFSHFSSCSNCTE